MYVLSTISFIRLANVSADMVFLQQLRKSSVKDKEIRVLLLGLDNAGKTSFLHRALGKSFEEVTPTLGFSIKSLKHGENMLHFWDVGGQKSLRPFWHNHFDQTDAIIWVLDASETTRVEISKDELHNVLAQGKTPEASLLILANKIDSVQEPESKVLANLSKALDIDSISGHNIKVMACSAHSGYNVEEAVQWVVNEAKQRLFSLG